MKSAGNPIPGTTPGGAPGGLAAPPPAIWNPSNWSNFYSSSSGMNINATVALDPSQTKEIMDGQRFWNGIGMGIGGLGTAGEAVFGYLLGKQQLETIGKYYETEAKIREYDKDVAIRALESQDHMTDAQLTAYQSAQTHEQQLARTQKETQIAITRIQERGKTQRAEVLSSSQAFSVGDPMGREARFYGMS